MAVIAAMFAAQKPATILSMVAWAFSIAGSAFFPALVLGIFWKRANRQGAIAGMVAGLLVTLYYMVRVQFDSIDWLGLHGVGMEPWLDIQSTAAGIWGVPVGFIVIFVVSILTPPPPAATQDLIERLRYPAP